MKSPVGKYVEGTETGLKDKDNKRRREEGQKDDVRKGMEMFKRRKKRRDERERQGGEGVTYLMPSWMAAFVSKHPNMHCSATRGRISLQHPISRGLLPPRRGPECA